MARTVETPEPERVRHREFNRPERPLRDFTSREAQHHFEAKETWKWAWIAYAVFLLAALVIVAVTYTTFLFSKYRGEILPGTYIAQVNVSQMTPAQARIAVTNRLIAISYVPIVLQYPGMEPWQPKQAALDLRYHLNDTINAAMGVGREGSFLEQLLDRLPIHRSHVVPLQYDYNTKGLIAYLDQRINVSHINQSSSNASLTVKNGHVQLLPSHPGRRVDIAATVRVVQDTMGSLTREVRQLPVALLQPVITDAYARSVQARVEGFLSQPPVLSVGKRVIATTRADISPMISFHDQTSPRRGTIVMDVSPDAVNQYVATLASQINQDPANARVTFSGGKVTLVSARHNGRMLDQAGAAAALLRAVKSLKPRDKIHLKVAVTHPSIDMSNPASLGINTLLGAGVTTFRGAGPTRLNDITAIANSLTGDLIAPNDEISFNTLVGTNWPERVYNDHEVDSNGQPVPSNGGAMQQVATTFLRALFAAGLLVEERHPHPYLLPWYSNPVGLDAIVSPAAQEDLRFKNDTGKYLLLQTRVEPIRQEVYIYVYGPKLGWQVAIDRLGKVSKIVPHGPDIIKVDTALPPGDTKQTAWAHNGENTMVQRTITKPNGTVLVTQLRTTYQPWQAIIFEGKSLPATATPVPSPSASPSPTPAVTPTPAPTPSPTLSH